MSDITNFVQAQEALTKIVSGFGADSKDKVAEDVRRVLNEHFNNGGKALTERNLTQVAVAYRDELAKGTPVESSFISKRIEKVVTAAQSAVTTAKLGFIGKNFNVGKGSWEDFKGIYSGEQSATTMGKVGRIGGATVLAGAGYYFGAKAVRGTKVNMETGEPEPMGWATRVGSGLLAAAALVGAVGAATFKSAAQRGV